MRYVATITMTQFKNHKLIVIAVAMMFVWFIGFLLPNIAQDNSVTAEAFGQANLRATTSVESDIVGEIIAGVPYPVIGRSELYPWLLVADPTTLQAKGWVYQDLVVVTGNLNNVPFSTLIVDPNTTTVVASPEVNTATVDMSMTPTANPIASPSPTPTATTNFNVAGVMQGEVNVRYGPSIDFPRLGVTQAGERYQITGYHTQYPWVQIAYDTSPNGFGWVAIDLMEIQGNIYTLPAITDNQLLLPTLTPTPPVISSSTAQEEDIALSPEFARLGNDLWAYVLSAGFDPATSRFGGLFIMDLQTREAMTFGNQYAFSGTSIAKIAIMARLYGALDTAPDARIATDIANTMICSENGATNRLLEVIGNGDQFLGADLVTDMYRSLGLPNSFITSPFITDPENPPVPPRPISIPDTDVDQTKANVDLSNQITVEDMGWLLTDIYDCAYNESGALLAEDVSGYEPRECRQMLHVMSNNNVDALLKAGVPVDTRVAHKHGWIPDTHGNAAVFFTPGGDYVIVMLLHQPTWLNYSESLPVIAEVSRRVYNYYNPDTPQDIVRDGFIPEATTCNFANTPLILDLRQPIWDQ